MAWGHREAVIEGVVLVASLWNGHAANMLWVSSTHPLDGSTPVTTRGSCVTPAGVPKIVETKPAKGHVVFSDIKGRGEESFRMKKYVDLMKACQNNIYYIAGERGVTVCVCVHLFPLGI